jgi:hypothetical protein
MKNIHLLPTEKPSRLFNDGIDLYLSDLMDRQGHPVTSYNIYTTSDEVIKQGDWCIYHSGEVIQYLVKLNTDNLKKIILTTDQDLIKDGVQAIDDEFLEWFVKNPSCEFVEIRKEKIILGKVAGTTYTDFKYKIIIPKEELKQETNLDKHLASLPKYSGFRRSAFVSKQETLEDAAERLSKNAYKKHSVKDDTLLLDEKIQRSGGFIVGFKEGMIDGAKWQQERMYSEEDMRKAFSAGEDSKEDEINGDGETSFEQWFEQFKKK